MIDVDKYCEEIIWYSEKDEKTGKYIIPIVVDFDHTISKTTHVGRNDIFSKNDNCFETMLKWQNNYGVKFILDTMRGKENVKPAIDFCRENGIEFYGVGRNPLQDKDGDKTTKVWGIFDIDDRNLGAFLIHPDDGSRPYVDWYKVDEYGSEILEAITKRIPEIEDKVLKTKAEVLADSENNWK